MKNHKRVSYHSSCMQHQIDLVPGTSVPNLPHYRMPNAEHAVLHRHIMVLCLRNLYAKAFLLVQFLFFSIVKTTHLNLRIALLWLSHLIFWCSGVQTW